MQVPVTYSFVPDDRVRHDAYSWKHFSLFPVSKDGNGNGGCCGSVGDKGGSIWDCCISANEMGRVGMRMRMRMGFDVC